MNKIKCSLCGIEKEKKDIRTSKGDQSYCYECEYKKHITCFSCGTIKEIGNMILYTDNKLYCMPCAESIGFFW